MNDVFIPMSIQNETKARRIWEGWPGASEAHTRSGLQRASNAATVPKDQRISLILMRFRLNPCLSEFPPLIFYVFSAVKSFPDIKDSPGT
jgi:hypothetical protein